MNYYILDTRAEPVFPQVNCLTQEDAHNLPYGELPYFIPELIFTLEKGAMITDVVSQASISAIGLLLSDKVKSVLDHSKLIKHKFFSANIDGCATPYFWLHLVDELEKIDWIDYEKSTFYTTEFGFREGNIKISSYQDLLLKKKEVGTMGTINIETIELNQKFNSTLDLFIIPFISNSIFISSRLKEVLNKNKITGIEIKEASIK